MQLIDKKWVFVTKNRYKLEAKNKDDLIPIEKVKKFGKKYLKSTVKDICFTIG